VAFVIEQALLMRWGPVSCQNVTLFARERLRTKKSVDGGRSPPGDCLVRDGSLPLPVFSDPHEDFHLPHTSWPAPAMSRIFVPRSRHAAPSGLSPASHQPAFPTTQTVQRLEK